MAFVAKAVAVVAGRASGVRAVVYYQCRQCRHQTTLTSGTLFQHTRLPLSTWMLGLYLLTSTKTDMSALELGRHLGINYKAAWRMKHKVMQAMAEREAPRRLEGFVQIDDAYLGGERNGGKTGRGAPGKQAFVVAVRRTKIWNTRALPSWSPCARLTTSRWLTGVNVAWHRMPNCTVMGWRVSRAASTTATRIRSW